MLGLIRDRIASGLESLAARLATEQRFPGAARIAQSIRTLAGVAITPDTAVTLAAVWACLRYLSQTLAVLPWHVMRDGKNGPDVVRSHPVEWLIAKRPSDEWSSFQFRETLVHWALRWGNGYAEIERDQRGQPFALWPIHPDRVQVCRAIDAMVSDAGVEILAGRIYYEVHNGLAGKSVFAASDIFHIRGFGEGPVGVNVISYAAQSLGWARAAQLFGASFFGNGLNVAGVVINKKALSPEGLAKQRAAFEDLYKGPGKANKTAHIDNDADWKPLGIDPQKSQMVEINQHLVEEVCRWFGVPPHKVMHLLRATFSNIESQAIEVVVDSISPWAKRFEDEADFKLFGTQNRQGLYTKMNMRGLLRGDTAARTAYYREMVGIGAYSPNRVLELEDENTIGPQGDIHVMQSQNVTLKTIAEGPPAAPEPKPAPTDPSPPDAVDPATEAAAEAAIVAMANRLKVAA